MQRWGNSACKCTFPNSALRAIEAKKATPKEVALTLGVYVKRWQCWTQAGQSLHQVICAAIASISEWHSMDCAAERVLFPIPIGSRVHL